MIYKGFGTIIEYSEEDGVYYGILINDRGERISDLVTWEADNLSDVEKEFKEAVDDYLEFLDEYRKDEVENV